MNRVVLVGRLTKDPDLRYTPNGVAVANFTLAINRPFKSQSGENEADFINCVVWRKAAENLANYMKKGNRVGVDGRLQTRTYEDSDGKTVYVTEVVADSVSFLESRSEQGGQQGGQPRSNQNQNNNNQQYNQNQNNNQQYNQNQNNNQQYNQNQNDPFSDPIDISDDDLPF